MKKQVKWILTALALVAVLVIAALLYRSLSQKYTPGKAADPAASTQSQTAAEASDAPEESVAFGEAPAPETAAAPEDLAPSEDLAADFAVFDDNNTEVRLSDHFGKPLVVNFWASWCGPCRSELPAFDAAAEEYAGKIDFMMVNLTDGYSETVESVKSFVEESGYTFPVYYDLNQEADNAYSVYSIPLTVLIRADGTVMDSHIGSMDASTLQTYLAQLTA